MTSYYKWDEDNEICIAYERSGECKMCGECCKARLSYRVSGDVTMQERKNGGTCTTGIGVWSEVTVDEERIFFKLICADIDKEICQSLDGNLCKSYDNRRPICSEWPFSPDDLELFPKCGYNFEQVEQWTYKEITNDTDTADS